MNYKFFYSILLASSLLSAQSLPAPEQDLIYSFLKPVRCTRSGLRCFIRHTFNHKMYAREFMPLSFLHMIDLLEFGKELDQPRSYIESVFSLFHERFQESRYANPYAIHELLVRLPKLIGKQFQDETSETTQQAMTKHLITSLRERFDELKKNPESMLTHVAEELYQISHDDSDLSIVETQTTLLRFFDQLNHKIIFDPREQAETWTICRQLMDDYITLYDYAVIPDKKVVNQLVWGLLYRFGYFIECAGSELDITTYASIKDAISKDLPEALMLNEQEELLTSKLKYIHDLLTEGATKTLAKQKGILIDSVIK